MAQRYDIAIIGAGTAGLSALSEVRKRTDNFIIINDGPYGTTCARQGCMPSKTFIELANLYHSRHGLEALAVRGAAALSLDGAALMERVRQLRDGFVAGAVGQTADLGERSIQGRARFVGPQTLEVDGHLIETKATIIATGSSPVVPDEWRALGQRVASSDEFFEWETLPPSVAVIGMGGVGLELAQALSRVGVEVYGFESGGRIGGLSDAKINRRALDLMQQAFPIYLGERAEVEAAGERVAVRGSGRSVEVDKVLVAVGRRPNLDGLGLERLGAAFDSSGQIRFNPNTMQLAGELPVYIAGDVNGCVPLLHEAADEGYIAARNALQAGPVPFVRRTPLMIVFSDPNIAVAGQMHAGLEPFAPAIGEADFAGQGRLSMTQRDRGLIRIYAEPDSGRLLGSEMCVPEGEHLAHLLAWAIGQGLTVHDLLRMPFYHPVVEEGLRTALRHVRKQLNGTAPALELAPHHRLPCTPAVG